MTKEFEDMQESFSVSKQDVSELNTDARFSFETLEKMCSISIDIYHVLILCLITKILLNTRTKDFYLIIRSCEILLKCSALILI